MSNESKDKQRSGYGARTEFWLSHALVIAGTVLGVYLAARAGFEKAVEFELVKSDRDSFYLRSALLGELLDNVAKAEEWGADFRGGNAARYIGKPDDFTVDRFVWTTMQEAPGTFEIPAEILTPIRRYYTSSRTHLAGITSKPPNPESADALVDEAKTMRDQVLPQLEANIDGLAERLREHDIEP